MERAHAYLEEWNIKTATIRVDPELLGVTSLADYEMAG